MSQEIVKDLRGHQLPDTIGQKFRVRIVDGTAINEPGSTGSGWRIHYSLEMPSLRCDTFTITGPETGENFQRYSVEKGDLLVADRGYCKRAGICHVLDHGGGVLVRFDSSNLPLFTYKGAALEPLKFLRTLEAGKYGDWNVWFRSPVDGELVKGRLCAIRKSKEAIELAKKKLRMCLQYTTEPSRTATVLDTEKLQYTWPRYTRRDTKAKSRSPTSIKSIADDHYFFISTSLTSGKGSRRPHSKASAPQPG